MLRNSEASGRIPFDDDPDSSPLDEGGLRAPPHLKGWRKFWWWFDFLILVKLARLRFIAVLLVIGLVITQWDTLVAYYDRWTRPTSAVAAGGSDIEYFCPMHLSVVRDNPKDKCPICFMPLAKRKKGESTDEALPAGIVSRVQLSPYRVVLAGVNTWKVSYQPLMKDIEAIGYIEFNERGQRTVSARVHGRIDELFVNETGQIVSAGDELASIYSPELFSTVENLRIGNTSRNEELIESTRTKLALLGVDARQIDEVLKVGKAETHLNIYSPISGHVIRKYVREGQYVKEGEALYDVADLSSVWVLAQIYEEDLAFLPLEQAHKHDAQGGDPDLAVVATTRALPNEDFRGRLSFIYPHVDQDTRTVAVRFEIDNPGHKLRPGMTAAVKLQVPPRDVSALKSTGDDAGQVLKNGHVLAVPESSVIDTGRQTIVYRQASPGVFEGVKVELGPKMSGPEDVVYFPVLRGLRDGDDVVTSGSFLVDAETRLNPAAGSIYFGGTSGSKEGPQAQVRPSTPEDPEATVKAALAELSEDERKLAEVQRFCPVRTNSLLGSMGRPFKLEIENQTVFLCCEGCKAKALAQPRQTLERVRGTTPTDIVAGKAVPVETSANPEEMEITAVLDQLPEADRRLAEEQRFCAVMGESRLGSMGAPIKLEIEGKTVFLCCEGCTKRAQANPKKTLAAVQKLREGSR